MRFQGSGRPLTPDGFYTALGRLRIGAAELWAVLTVESGGFGFLPDRRPRLRFNAQVFHEMTDGAWSQAFPEISPATQEVRRGGEAEREYDRLMTALLFDEEAAFASASWGLGQINGYHMPDMGFKAFRCVAAAMVTGEDAQLLAMVRYIENSEATCSLRHHDWEQFALRYRGRSAMATGYVNRLAAAFHCAEHMRPDLAVRAAQAALLYIGIDPGPVDGIIGERTRRALRQFNDRPQQPVRGLFIGAETILQRVA